MLLSDGSYDVWYMPVFQFHAVIFHEYSCAQQPILQQLVYLNIPAYNLNLYTQYEDQRWERLSVPIEVGKGVERRSQTPTGQGELYVKAMGVTFEYGEQNPQNWWEKRLPTQIPLIRIR